MSKKTASKAKGTSGSRKATPKKKAAPSTAKKKTTRKSTAKPTKAGKAKAAKKAAPKKAVKKASSKKAALKKAAPKKAAPKNAAPKKTAPKKAAPKKAAPKKAAPKKAEAKKATPKKVTKRRGGRSKKISEEVLAQIAHVRELKGRNCVEELSSILMDTLDKPTLIPLAIATVEELGNTGSPKAIDTLSFAWNNCQNVETRSAMVQALATFPHKQVLSPLERIALSTGVGTELRLQAVAALAQHRTNASWTALGKVLRESAETGDKALQSASIEALRSNNSNAVPFLLKALFSKDEEEQVSAATALGVTGDRSALDSLRTLSGKAESLAVKEAATRAAILLYCS